MLRNADLIQYKAPCLSAFAAGNPHNPRSLVLVFSSFVNLTLTIRHPNVKLSWSSFFMTKNETIKATTNGG
jgi:hypothetical protein